MSYIPFDPETKAAILRSDLLNRLSFSDIAELIDYSSDATILGQIVSTKGTFKSMAFPNLVTVLGDIDLSQTLTTVLESFSAPLLTTCRTITVYANDPSTVLTSFDMSSLITISHQFQGLFFYNVGMPVLDFSSLVNTNSLGHQVQNCPNLTTIDLSSLEDAGQLTLDTNPLLTSLVLNPATNLPLSSTIITANNSALPVSNVNDILVKVDGWGRSNGYLDLSNQTPLAAPTGAGAAAVTSLLGKGWSVTTD